MLETIDPRFDKALARLKGLSTTSVNASYSLSPEILSMLEALTPGQPAGSKGGKKKTKKTLEKIVIEFVINTVGVDEIPLGLIAGIEHPPAGYAELEELFQAQGLTKDQAAEARWYFEGAYESPGEFWGALKKSVRRGGDKLVRTFFIPSGHKELIDKYAQATGMDRSSLLEFLIRTYWSRMRGRWQHLLFEYHERILEAKAQLESVVNDMQEHFSTFEPFEKNGFPDPQDLQKPGQDLIVMGVSNLVYLTKSLDEEVLFYLAEAFLEASTSRGEANKNKQME